MVVQVCNMSAAYSSSALDLTNNDGRDEVAGFFKKPVNGIKALIAEQVLAVKTKDPQARSPKGILLVGGFGSSRYLYDQVARRYEPMEVHQATGDRPYVHSPIALEFVD